jgi:ABC-type sugar transport system ATPase subunit
LSGGNQQKVVVAKLAATEPRMLFLDEPTQGVDVEAKVEILRIIDDLSKRGVAVGVVSDELSELMDICDRIIVFYRGRIVREFRKGKDEITTQKLLAAIEGETMEAVG